ncbi:FAD:protein FMN transferase [Polaribacter sp. HaHaR_3_91]|uniref:FAD:protein FMN transferase n=1 Tax=Polaribacter sp. HaHaR_3_91 TaxID=2745561 RepID=UPI001C4F9E66|nr:FAD:protein FMN transferase [Polaribacter sp. HaHaR_3_91]QXP63320.1 FAD:protein FMN transferase [Polaribacter sp. HaHaR_3_91]
MILKNKVIVTIVLLVFLSCSKEKIKDYTLTGRVFGTTYKIVYLDGAKDYQTSLDSLFFLMNKSLSTYIPSSDISRINKGDSTVIVDDLFLEVFKKSKRIYTETNGYFDPTVGNLVNAWGFGPKNERVNLNEDQVTQQMQYVGLDKVTFVDGKIRKQDPKIYLDFNSIAKGFGIDVVARFLDSKNISNYLIEIGGEIRAKGIKKEKHPWVIKLVNPIKKDSTKGYRKINLSNKSMATSGNYRKFRITKDGHKYVHTVNPKTGYAVESNLLSASVIADLDCADTDAYATAFMAMGLEKAKEFLDTHKNIDAILLFNNENGDLEEYTTNAFK